jgi:carbonic anhydrase
MKRLFENNRVWADAMRRRDPDYFVDLAREQHPRYLWIGCADSRVPANDIVGLHPGELFVHRNIANVVVQSDLNGLSVLQYAVDVLRVDVVVVCGHYGCGGVQAALDDAEFGLIDNWLRHVQDVEHKHHAMLDALPAEARAHRLCELNVIEQVVNVCHTTIVRHAWERGQDLDVHGVIYGLEDGLLHDLGFGVGRVDDLDEHYVAALATLADRAA